MNKEKEIAVIMAAGFGTRMKPLTDKIAKPLIKINGTPMIETIINGLMHRNISHIYVIVGYKKEQFDYLQKKYTCLSIIENTDYSTKNNISSIYAACDVIEKENANCFICEGDLYISEPEIFQAELNTSCYFGKFLPGDSNDWVFKQDSDGKIIWIGIGGKDVYNMTGIAYFLKKDINILANVIRTSYNTPGNESLFWDEIVNLNINQFHLTIHDVTAKQLVELDTIEELRTIDPNNPYFNKD